MNHCVQLKEVIYDVAKELARILRSLGGHSPTKSETPGILLSKLNTSNLRKGSVSPHKISRQTGTGCTAPLKNIHVQPKHKCPAGILPQENLFLVPR